MPRSSSRRRPRRKAILKDLKAGKDFAAAAKENSQDPGSAPNGGDLGFFEQGQMVPQFDQVAFTLKPGQMSELVETQFGYHIIKVAEKQDDARRAARGSQGDRSSSTSTDQNRQAQTEAFVNALKAKAKIDILM